MTRDDIIRMAREADVHHINLDPDYFDELQRFAAIVAAATREECAQFLEHGVDLAGMSGSPDLQAFCATLLQGCADGLRKGGQQ
jgi:hypothetical protein